jgi:hypothetical protein
MQRNCMLSVTHANFYSISSFVLPSMFECVTGISCPLLNDPFLTIKGTVSQDGDRDEPMEH